MIVDALGNLIRFVLLPGQRHDITSFDALMAGIYCLALIGDKGFDAGWLRERLRANDMEAVIPLREGTSGYADCPEGVAERFGTRAPQSLVVGQSLGWSAASEDRFGPA